MEITSLEAWANMVYDADFVFKTRKGGNPQSYDYLSVIISRKELRVFTSTYRDSSVSTINVSSRELNQVIHGFKINGFTITDMRSNNRSTKRRNKG